MRILIFGDSITEGMWDSRGGWAHRLVADFFAEQMKDLSDNSVPWVINLGISGNTTRDLLDRFDAETNACKDAEKAFVFAIGTNDAWINGDGSFNMSDQEYAKNIEQLITKARKSSGKILFVGLCGVDEARTTPVSWIDISYTNERTQLFNRTLQRVCQAEQVTYLPVFEVFQRRHKQEGLLPDGLHPNDKGHKLIYDLVKPALKALLRP